MGETILRAALRAWVRPSYRAKTGPHEASQRLVRPRFGHLRDFSDSLSTHSGEAKASAPDLRADSPAFHPDVRARRTPSAESRTWRTIWMVS